MDVSLSIASTKSASTAFVIPCSRSSTPSGHTYSIASHRSGMDQEDAFDNGREIKCPVHGYIPLSKLATSIIDTPQFQRLRYLKQMGTSYFVWPGAAHNRFEHSIGVYHLCKMMVTRLRECQPELEITDRDFRCVSVAGLCHDLGHGPFSHVWDNYVIPAVLPGTKWKHEDGSEMMLDYLVKANNIDLQPDEVRFIKDLIYGGKKHTKDHSPPEKEFLFEIVANKRNGIDVDKFDYIARDTHAISCGTITDLIRLIKSARVIDGQICYSEKNTTSVFGLFQERFNLHKTIYNHKTARSIEFMIVDALKLADPHLHIAKRVFDPEQYVHLTDDVLLEVERSKAPELKDARTLIHRIRVRDLYKLVDKTFLPWENQEFWLKSFTPEKIVQTAKSLKCPEFEDPEVEKLVAELTEGHVIVDLTTLHHGMGDKFPLDNCKFYGKYNPNQAFPPRKEEDISHLLPKYFGEVWNRVFTRDARFLGVIQRASRALHESLIQTLSSGSLSANVVIQRSATPEAPTTPRATSSMLSISSLGYGSDGAGAGTGAIPATPFYNNCITVPPTFSPVKAKAGAGVTQRNPIDGKSATGDATQPKKRGEEEVSQDAGGKDALPSGSPKKKKTRTR